MRALAYANGVIVFSRRTTRATLPITAAPARQLRTAVRALARRAYDGKTLLVPGLPEAANWEQRRAALVRFQAEVEKHLGRPELAERIERYESRKARSIRRSA